MKKAIPPEDLPYIHNSNTQLEYRFPLVVDTHTAATDVMVALNLISTLGPGIRILIPAGWSDGLRIPVELECDADIITRIYTYDPLPLGDLDVLRDITQHYDVVYTRGMGLTSRHFGICQHNRCLILATHELTWDAGRDKWARNASAAIFHRTPTILNEDADENLFNHQYLVCRKEDWKMDNTLRASIFYRP